MKLGANSSMERLRHPDDLPQLLKRKFRSIPEPTITPVIYTPLPVYYDPSPQIPEYSEEVKFDIMLRKAYTQPSSLPSSQEDLGILELNLFDITNEEAPKMPSSYSVCKRHRFHPFIPYWYEFKKPRFEFLVLP